MELRSLSIGFAVVVLTVVLTIGGAGCATDGTNSSSGSDDSTSAGTGIDTGSEFVDGNQNTDSGSNDVTGNPIGELATVYFEYDQSDIRSDSAETLRANAALIKNNDRWGRVVVQGNTDERGSEEYNLALGERRANAVKRYLVDLGVSSDRLRTVSFGEATPAVPGHDESAYRYNRRSDFASN